MWAISERIQIYSPFSAILTCSHRRRNFPCQRPAVVNKAVTPSIRCLAMPWHPLRYRHPLQPYRWSTETRVAQRRKRSTTNLRLPNISSALALRIHHDQQNTAIEVVGSVRTVRKQKSLAFLSIGDGSTVDVLQAVLHPDQAQGYDASRSLGIWTLLIGC